MTLIFVDCEAYGGSPVTGRLTEFGAVALSDGEQPPALDEGAVQHFVSYLPVFHGIIIDSEPNPLNPAVPMPGEYDSTRAHTVFASFRSWLRQFDPPFVFVSDNVAFDWQWINCGFHEHLGENPFGHSGRRIGDYAAGLRGRWRGGTQGWKRMRITKHDHNPVHDAQGNVEAFLRLGGTRP